MQVHMLCNKCGARLVLDEDVTILFASDFPLSIHCGKCSEVTYYRSKSDLLPLPKMPMGVAEATGTVVTVAMKIDQERRDKDAESRAAKRAAMQSGSPESTIEELMAITIHDRIGMLSECMASINKIVDSMSRSVELLGQELATDFAAAYGKADVFMRGISEAGMQDFITSPFLRIEVETPEGSGGVNSVLQGWHPVYLILAPRFYELPLGFPLEILVGGWRGYLVNGMSRISYPLDAWIEKCLEMPVIPRLYLRGNKLLGQDFRALYRAIPGLIEDHDHSPNNPSMVVSRPREFRNWAVKQGVNPFPITRITQSDSMQVDLTGVPFQTILANPKFVEAYAQFCETGRMMVAWDNMEMARDFIGLLTQSWNGETAILVSDEDFVNNYQDWKKYVGKGRWIMPANQFPNHLSHPLDSVAGPDIKQRLIVVDCTACSIDDRLLSVLHLYSGNLILLVSDWMMDMDEVPCMDAVDLYGLVGQCNIQTDRVTVKPSTFKMIRNQHTASKFWEAVVRMRKITH